MRQSELIAPDPGLYRRGVPQVRSVRKLWSNLEHTKMHMPGAGLLMLLVGLTAGWLAVHIVQGTGFGVVGDVVIRVIGAFIGALLPQLGIRLSSGIVEALLNATLGALILLISSSSFVAEAAGTTDGVGDGAAVGGCIGGRVSS
jgi:uncharacterized membrane protein YeaQ/YmgE (transglycosylase-associated protein family)